MKKLMITLFALTIGLSSLTSCSSDNKSSSTESLKSYSHSVTELDLLDEVNLYRVSVGLNPLEIIEHISYKSSEHNDYMIQTLDVSHEGFTSRAQNLQTTLNATRVSENIAYGFVTNASAVNAWINSPAHKVNLDGDFTHFGASIKMDDQGRKYYTNMFIKK